MFLHSGFSVTCATLTCLHLASVLWLWQTHPGTFTWSCLMELWGTMRWGDWTFQNFRMRDLFFFGSQEGKLLCYTCDYILNKIHVWKQTLRIQSSYLYIWHPFCIMRHHIEPMVYLSMSLSLLSSQSHQWCLALSLNAKNFHHFLHSSCRWGWRWHWSWTFFLRKAFVFHIFSYFF